MAEDNIIQDNSPKTGGLNIHLLTPGEKFGDYQVMKCLSLGVLYGLYKVQQITDQSFVCLAVFHSDVCKDLETIKKIKDFVNKVSQIDHENILKIEKYQEIKGRHCIILEDFEGINLSDYIDEVKIKYSQEISASVTLIAESPIKKKKELLPEFTYGIPESEVKEILIQITQAISAANVLDFFHHHLNPLSVLRSQSGKIKIFGIGLISIFGREEFVKISNGRINPVTFGLEKVHVNLLETLSPEMRLSKIPAVSNEVYTIGYIGYYLLTGRRPGDDKIVPSSNSAAISSGWDVVIMKCLNLDPNSRYTEISQLLIDIKKVDRLGNIQGEGGKGRISKHLAKIPLPHKIATKVGPKVLKALRVAILCLLATAIIGIGSLSYIVIFSDDEQDDGPVVKRVSEGEEAQLIISIVPANAKIVFSVRGSASFIVTDGALEVNLPTGDYILTFDAVDHISKSLRVSIGNEQIKSKVSLDVAWGNLTIDSDPGANVVATRGDELPIDLGIISEEGVLKAEKKLKAGKYNVEVTKKNFKSHIFENIILPLNKHIKRDVKLEALPGKLKIVSEPEGAIVYFNRKNMGLTPLDLIDLPIEKSLRFAVVKKLYRSMEQVITLSPGSDDVLDFGNLVRKTGTLFLDLAFDDKKNRPELEDEITVTLDDTEYNYSNGKVTFIDEGDYTVRVSHVDHIPVTKLVKISDGSDSRLNINLKPKNTILSIKVEPEVQFKLRANNIEVKQNEKAEFEIAPNNFYNFEVHAKNYLIVKQSLNIVPNTRHEWEINLVRIPGPILKKEWVVPYAGIEMVWIEPGRFSMGSPLPEQARMPSEGPKTTVRISKGFWIGRYEVTQNNYFNIMKKNPSRFPDPLKPVERLSWYDAVAYCENLTDNEREGARLIPGYVYRLPTEAEWEFACRANSVTPFNFGNIANSIKGNFNGDYPRIKSEESAVIERGIYGTAKVGKYKPNAWGIYDMHGNVREWCADIFNSRYPGGLVTDWAGPTEGNDRLYRGGGWEDYAHQCRSATRERLSPSTKSSSLGFRVVYAPK